MFGVQWSKPIQLTDKTAILGCHLDTEQKDLISNGTSESRVNYVVD